MSVQLILYPQNYNGIYSSIATPILNQYVADGKFSVGITGTIYPTINANPENNALIYAEANSSWRAYRTTGASGIWAASGSPTVTTTLNLPCSSSGYSVCGVYQKISNLTVGVTYDLSITYTSGSGIISQGVLQIGNQFQNFWTGASGATFQNLGQTSNLYGSQGTSTADLFQNNTAVVLGATSNTVVQQFQAYATEEVLVLRYEARNGETLSISNISITETITSTTPAVYTDLTDGQVICDLYEDESIPLSLSIDDFKNVAEKVQSYSKDFHLPNTKRNNKIFSHIFEVTRTTDAISFNPYAKTKAILKEDSYTLFEGFLKLIDIKDKESEISYNVNLFSEPVTLKEILDTRTFADIDFTELQHDYTITNIKNSWVDATGLTLASALATDSFALESGLANTKTNVLKYPFVNWRGDWTFDAFGHIELDDLEQVFRPWIQVNYLIKRIINEAGFEFVSNFFDTANFKKLFMDFNWGQGLGSNEVMESFWRRNFEESLIYAGTSFTELEVGSLGNSNPTGIAATYISGNTITAVVNNTTLTMSYDVWVYNSEAGTSYTYEAEWQHYHVNAGTWGAAGTITSIDNTGTVTLGVVSGLSPSKHILNGWFSITMDTGDTLKPVFKASTSGKVFQGNHLNFNFGGSVGSASTQSSFFQVGLTSVQVVISNLLHAIRGETSQWEFLKGIFTMFNLVVMKEDEVLRIEPYADIFLTNNDTTKRNWTDKVDISEINLKPLELVRKTIFTYEDDDSDYSLNVYKKATSGYLYGTKKLDGSTATASQVTILTGEEEIIATPFAPTLIRPATEFFDSVLTIPQIYSGNEDGTEFEDFENLPRILYNVGVKSLNNHYIVPAQNTVATSNETTFLQFAHLTEIPTTTTTPTVDFNFGECQLIQPIGGSPTDNLYQTYYAPYYDELYHPDTRVMTMKVNLTPADIMSFRFYDTVVIKNREYRVNKIDYKPNTLAKVEFILIS